MMKMATYPGMSLSGEVRESISLDEDDLSDVEDEVFIRDGKNGYKLAEELNVKRPLMAPRRKLTKPDLTTRIKNRPPCRVFCKPCCYIFAALSVLIGLIILVVILVSIFPLPLDKFRDWVISRTKTNKFSNIKILPCNNLKITDIWKINLPVITTDSPIRTLDIDQDGIEDVIFGFGTGDNYNVFPPDIFCPIFLGVPPPCEGGIIALNGVNGNIIWRYWLNDTIYSVQCNEDVNGDKYPDCLIIGIEGTISIINAKNGSVIWEINNSRMDVYVANFVPDQNNDSIADVLASHTSLNGDKDGHLVLISGKSGKELKSVRTPNGAKTFLMPQLLKVNNTNFVIFGTGTPNTPGNLSITTLKDIVEGNLSNTKTLYKDNYKGIITQSVLVDITGDKIPDIITAMYNSTIVAINGDNFKQIWNFTILDSESNVLPTPGYFNDDNITDFLIIYQKYDNILNYNYTQTFIIDGKNGKPIYDKPISSSIITQISGLTLSMENYGFDLYLFWSMECANMEKYKKIIESTKSLNIQRFTDICHQQFNTTSIIKLNALNQYDQPPGFEIYNSVNRMFLEFNNTKSPIKRIKEYLKHHPKLRIIDDNLNGQSEIDDNYNNKGQEAIRIHKYGSSSFRHKDNRQGIVKDYMNNENNNRPIINSGPSIESDYDWSSANQDQDATLLNVLPSGNDLNTNDDFNNYNSDDSIVANDLYNNQKQLYNNDESLIKQKNRDPRSKDNNNNSNKKTTKKKNLSNDIYDYKNMKMARNRLLHDLNNLPNEILRDTYFKNMENQLKKSKFEQRDINSHNDKLKDNLEVEKLVNEAKNSLEKNLTYSLWDIESEKEEQDRKNGYWRGKRNIDNYNKIFDSIKKITSVGAIVKSFNLTTNHSNSIDFIFITYWQDSKKTDDNENWKNENEDCIDEECLTEMKNFKADFQYFNQLNKLNLGQMTVYRIRIECVCDIVNKDERCAKFLSNQNWSQYLGKYGDGVVGQRG